MAYDEHLAQRIRDAIGTIAPLPVQEKKMFGGLAFLLGGHMSVAASGQGGLLVRMDPDEADALLDEPGVRLMEMRGRTMRGWLRVDLAAAVGEEQLGVWVRRGIECAAALPPK